MAVCSIMACLVVTVVAVAELVGGVAAATYVVGDSVGWRVPPGGATFYKNWSSNHVFAVGDVLVFNFTTGIHTVAQVTKASFDGCNFNNPINNTGDGPARVTLNSAGEVYYLCTIGQHCSLGQKLAINVTKTSAPSSPSPSPSPSTHNSTGSSLTNPPLGLIVITLTSSVIHGLVGMYI